MFRNLTLIGIGAALALSVVFADRLPAPFGPWITEQRDALFSSADAALTGQVEPRTDTERAEATVTSARSAMDDVNAYDYTALATRAQTPTVEARMAQGTAKLEEVENRVIVTSVRYPTGGCQEGFYCHVFIEGRLVKPTVRTDRFGDTYDDTRWYATFGFHPATGEVAAFTQPTYHPTIHTPTEFIAQQQAYIDRESDKQP